MIGLYAFFRSHFKLYGRHLCGKMMIIINYMSLIVFVMQFFHLQLNNSSSTGNTESEVNLSTRNEIEDLETASNTSMPRSPISSPISRSNSSRASFPSQVISNPIFSKQNNGCKCISASWKLCAMFMVFNMDLVRLKTCTALQSC